MKKSFYFSENAKLFSMFDETHQELLKQLEKITSVWFMNILMRTLLQYKSNPKDSENLTEEDIRVLTHADKTMVLFKLALYCASRMDFKIEKALQKSMGDFRQGFGDDQVDSLLLVLYNLIDLDLDEFRHYGPEFMVSNSNLCN